MDVNLDGVVAHLFAPLAQSLDQLVFADQTSRALQQDLKQTQLTRRKLNHLAVNGGHTP